MQKKYARVCAIISPMPRWRDRFYVVGECAGCFRTQAGEFNNIASHAGSQDDFYA
jgi:hypothetical protein